MNDLLAFVRARHPRAGVPRVEVRDDGVGVVVVVASARPGLLIGKQGVVAEQLTAALAEQLGREVTLQIVEIRRPELEPLLMADHVVDRLSRGDPDAEQVARQAVDMVVRAGADAARVVVSGAYDVDVGDVDGVGDVGVGASDVGARVEGENAGRCFDVSVTIRARTKTDR